MCGRLANGATPEEIAAWHEARRDATLAIREGSFFLPSYNTAPTHVVPVLRDEDEQAVLEPMNWGVWATFGPKGKQSQRFLFNATCEKYVEGNRSMWRRSWRRCLVVASCFFEWEGKGRTGQAHAIRLADDELVAFGALWKVDVCKRPKDGEPTQKGPVAVIMTCPPNELVQRFHHRAPVIIPPEHWDAWLDPDAPRDLIAQLCLPLPSEAMVAYPVPNEVGKVGVQDPSFLEGL
jgi:putative SOS response-associated peptidase YedK